MLKCVFHHKEAALSANSSALENGIFWDHFSPISLHFIGDRSKSLPGSVSNKEFTENSTISSLFCHMNLLVSLCTWVSSMLSKFIAFVGCLFTAFLLLCAGRPFFISMFHHFERRLEWKMYWLRGELQNRRGLQAGKLMYCYSCLTNPAIKESQAYSPCFCKVIL